MGRNGYFQIIVRDDGTYMKIFPAVEDGEPVKIEEVKRYLEKHSINGYDLVRLNQVLHEPEGGETFLFPTKILQISEDMHLEVSDNRMKATVRFYPPSDKGGLMSREEILRSLGYQGIKYGIQEDQIDNFVSDRTYCADYIVALGTPEIPGTDAEITYHFNLNPNAKPKLNPDGTVDFRNLETFSEVKTGDVIATLVKEVWGTNGSDIAGTPLVPKAVQIKRHKYGKDIEISEDELTLTSLIDGHVSLNTEGKVQVSNTYEVKGDIDTGTGNIKYDGNVIVHGNVRAGFTVIASGNVEVDGVVEGARIFSQGQIILKRGIQGMGKGVLHAKGNIIAKFIESAMVSSEQNIDTESIMHSKVDSKGEITVRGKKGVIVGGHVRSTIRIHAQAAGSAMGGQTILQVGTDPGIQDRIKELETEQRNLEADRAKTSQMITMLKTKKQKGQLPADKIELLQKSLLSYNAIDQKLKEIQEELSGCYENLSDVKHAKIKIEKDVHNGVKIMIGNEFLIISKSDFGCQYTLGDNGISRVYA